MIPSDDVCGKCDASLIQKVLRDARLGICPVCRTVTLAQIDFDRLIVQPLSDDLQLDAPVPTVAAAAPIERPYPPPPPDHDPGRPMWIALASVLAGLISVALVLLLALFMFLTKPVDSTGRLVRPRILDQPVLPIVQPGQVDVPAPVGDVPGPPGDDPPVVSPSTPTQPVQPAPAPKVNPTQPAASPPPVPAPEKPPPTTVRALVKAGWNTVDRDASQAADLFGAALAKQPGHADANYGYGYALLSGGRSLDARPYLCKALANGDAEIQRETRALLSRNQLTCN